MKSLMEVIHLFGMNCQQYSKMLLSIATLGQAGDFCKGWSKRLEAVSLRMEKKEAQLNC